jgi:hypothetical protein
MTVLAISHQPVLLDVADRVYRVEGGVATAISAGEVRGQGVASATPARRSVPAR